MTNKTTPNSHESYRILDANLNRLREGIRVIEDIFRYTYNDKEKSTKLKTLRHKCRIECDDKLLECRDIVNDVLKSTTKSESSREDLQSIITANFKRTQESSRVIEEILKLTNSHEAEKFKHIRYELYDLEK